MSSNPYESPNERFQRQPPPSSPRASANYTLVSDPSGLAVFVKVMLVVSLVMSAVALGSDFMELNAVNAFLANQATVDDLDASDVRQQMVALAGLAVLLITGIPFLMWVYRVNKNCHGFGAVEMKTTPGWSVGWFFIPIANFWKPFQTMKEIWQVSTDPYNWEYADTSPLLGCWWGAWIGSNMIGYISARVGLFAQDIETFRMSTYLAIVCDGLQIVAAILAFALVSAITAKQLKLAGTSPARNAATGL